MITETARLVVGQDDEARGLQARRSRAQADGPWVDLNDPTASEPLADRRGTEVDVEATFGPLTATAGDEGLVEGRIRVRCPG